MVIEKENEILDLSFDSALGIIKLEKHLKINREFEIANRLILGATSVGINLNEAQAD